MPISTSRHRSASSPRCAARWGRDWERLPTDPTRYRLICPKLCTCDKLTRRAKFRFAADPNHQYIHCVPSPSEGRLAIVMNAGRDAVDAAASGTRVLTNDAISGETFWRTGPARRSLGESRALRTVKTCGPGTPTLVSSSQAIADDGGKKARSPGRARYKP